MKEEELVIESVNPFKRIFLKSVCTYIAQNIIFQKKKEANEIQFIQDNFFC